MAKFALISHVLPPSPSGQAVMLYRILSAIHPEAYYMILSREVPSLNQNGADSQFRLPGRHYLLPSESERKWPNRLRLNIIGDIVHALMRIRSRRRHILAVLRREPGTTSIIACSGDLADIPAGFLASRKVRVPFFAYIFDDYVYQWKGHYRTLAKWLAPFVFKRSAGIIGPNEFVLAAYQQRYGVKCTLIRNPVMKTDRTAESRLPWPAEKDRIKILFTGAVCPTNMDCFHNLLGALESLEAHKLELHIFTNQPRQRLDSLGIKGKSVFIHAHVPFTTILEKQRQADILFLPLSFAPAFHEVIRTSAPAKMGEYLGSGRPVLAHVPADSFVAHYFTRYQCGSLVTGSDAGELANEMKKIINAPEFRATLIANARRQAELDFSPETARERWLALLQKKYN